MDVFSSNQFLSGLSGETDLFFRSEEDNIGKSGFDGVAHPAGAVGARGDVISWRRIR